MDSTHTVPSLLFFEILLFSFLCLCLGQIPASDQACVTPLETLFPCLPYAQGKSQFPTATCCTHMNQVFNTQPKCLCALIALSAQKSDSGLPPLNQTLALGLPSACGLKADPRRCPGLLGISPSSPDARIFESPSSTGSTVPAAKDTGTAAPIIATANSDKKKNGATTSVPGRLHLALTGALSVMLLKLLVL